LQKQWREANTSIQDATGPAEQQALDMHELAASAAGTGPAEQQLLLLGQLPPQRGVLGAQHGVVFYTYCYAISISTGAVSHTYVNSWFIALNPILMVGHRV